MNKEELHRYIEENQPNICQISCYHNDHPVYQDEFNNYQKNDCVHVMSVTKSIVSLLIGIAIDQGKIHSVDDKVLDYFPDYPIKRGEKTIQKVTIRHLLTMRAPYKGKGDPWTKVCSSQNWTFASLDFLGGKEGLSDTFRYTTVCLHILSGLLYRATGMKTVEYANKYLFEPCGIQIHENFYAKDAEEHKAFTLNKKPIGPIWFADPDGLGTPGYGLSFNSDDMAKIGRLCLQKGIWNGRQIISDHWIDEMTNARTIEDANFRGMLYGYLWWIIDPDKPIYAAIGNSGNVIYVNTEEKIVIGLSAYFKPTVFDRIDFIQNILEPFIRQL